MKKNDAEAQLAAALGPKVDLQFTDLQFVEFAGLRLKKSDAEAQLAAALGLKPRGVNGGVSSALTSAP